MILESSFTITFDRDIRIESDKATTAAAYINITSYSAIKAVLRVCECRPAVPGFKEYLVYLDCECPDGHVENNAVSQTSKYSGGYKILC